MKQQTIPVPIEQKPPEQAAEASAALDTSSLEDRLAAATNTRPTFWGCTYADQYRKNPNNRGPLYCACEVQAGRPTPWSDEVHTAVFGKNARVCSNGSGDHYRCDESGKKI